MLWVANNLNTHSCFLLFSLAFISEPIFTLRSTRFSTYVDILLEISNTLYLKACGYRQLILNARAEKNVRMQRLCQGISTEVDIGKRVMVFYSSSVAENVSIARKGEKGRGKIQKGSRDRSLMANIMEKKSMKYISYRWKMSVYCFLFIDLHSCV